MAVASGSRKSGDRTPRGPSSRGKREDILSSATEHFGRHGYEYTKWADIAAAVGVGPTALYHYFETKLHCLYEIQAEAVQANREEFDRISGENADCGEALVCILESAFDLTEHEVLRNRVLVAEQALAGLQRASPREEEARRLARSRMRDLEFAWATFLTRGMEQSAIPQADPQLLARAILGLYNSVWHWYRPQGSVTLPEVKEFYVARCLAVAGLETKGSKTTAAPRRKRASRKAA